MFIQHSQRHYIASGITNFFPNTTMLELFIYMGILSMYDRKENPLNPCHGFVGCVWLDLLTVFQ